MRRTLVTMFALSAAMAPAVHAQRANAGRSDPTEFGVLGGATIATLHASTTFATDTRTGPMGGLYTTFRSRDLLGFEPELLFVQKGARLPYPGVEGYNQLRFLELPLLARVSVTGPEWGRDGNHVRPYLLVGPTLGWRLSCDAKAPGTEEVRACSDVNSAYRRGEVTATAGAGIDNGRLRVGARYDYGLTRVSASTDPTLRTRTLAFELGYALRW